MATTLVAPAGSSWTYDEVKTKGGTESLGDVPILTWESVEGATDYYGEQGVIDSLDGTSFRVSFQSIARRMKIKDESDDAIAQAQLDYRPGKRAVGASTPTSRAARAARSAAEKVSNPDLISELLAKIASGDLSESDLAALVR